MTRSSSDSALPVVIVGARPSGAALAAHLGARGLACVVVDRATFPSTPSVPSSPLVYPSAMQLLDELGVDESEYFDPHAKMSSFLFDFDPWWRTNIPMPTMYGRGYALGLDRARFDHALLRRLERHPSAVQAGTSARRVAASTSSSSRCPRGASA